MPESTQHKLDRIRPPRVQITYDVEIGDAIVKKELPFVVGVMADLSGTDSKGKPSKTDLKPLRERKYIEIDRDNFNDVLASVGPELKGMKVKTNLKTDGARFALTPEFMQALKDKNVSEEALDRLKPKHDKRSERRMIGKKNFVNKVRKALGEKEYERVGADIDKVLESAKVNPEWLDNETLKPLLEDELFAGDLKFSHLEDFTPIKVLKQVPSLRHLFEARQRLNDMLAKLDGNEALDSIFQEVAREKAKFDELKASVGNPAPSPTTPTPAPPNPAPPAN